MLKMQRASLKDLCTTAIVVLQITLVSSAPLVKEPRLSVVDWNNYNYRDHNGPGTYAFGYDIEDPETDNVQFRNEERHANGSVTGSYGFVDPDGTARIVHYIADNLGYRASIEDSPIKLLKPLILLEISELPHLSENPDVQKQEVQLSNIEFVGKIVTPDVPNQQNGFINNIQYPIQGSGFNNQNYQEFNNQFPTSFVSNQVASGFGGGFSQIQGPFGENLNYQIGHFSRPPQTTTEPIWPNFNISSLFELKSGQTPLRTFIKINNKN